MESHCLGQCLAQESESQACHCQCPATLGLPLAVPVLFLRLLRVLRLSWQLEAVRDSGSAGDSEFESRRLRVARAGYATAP